MRKTDPRITFGKRLAALRKKRGWSQEKLALETGLARSYLGGVERGQRNISLLNICRLAEGLSLPPSELLQLDWSASNMKCNSCREVMCCDGNELQTLEL